MSASKYSSETAKRKQNSERRQHGMEKGLTSAPLWRRHAEALMRNSAKPDRGIMGKPARAQCDEVLKSLGVSSELSPNSPI